MSTDSSANDGVSRREFLSWFWLGWITFSVVLGSLGALLGRFLFPNVLFEKPSKFRAGAPDTYSLGIDERFKDTEKVWIYKSPTGIVALSAVCTHLGCTPNWLNAEDKFKCPCHGSGFRSSGLNFEGPAPRPLERFAIALDDSGQIVIDKSRSIRKLTDWESTEFLLKV
ncbi:MAG: ubiquinol-cytochrome c reductase iron-sulfur subunit [Proteobacteria bacterium]|nr:ubiquinol-cytochrome c reductase iron-sulfur subunit [Pseudomonadota bacterium]